MNNRFVFTDLHGNGEVWEEIKKFIGNQPTVFLGDAADRGADGFRIIYEMKTCLILPIFVAITKNF